MARVSTDLLMKNKRVLEPQMTFAMSHIPSAAGISSSAKMVLTAISDDVVTQSDAV